MPWLVGVDDWLASYGTEQRKKQNSILFQRKNGYGVRQLFAAFTAVTERNFHVIFTEQRNFTTAERWNGNGRTATERWKPGMRLYETVRPRPVSVVKGELRMSSEKRKLWDVLVGVRQRTGHATSAVCNYSTPGSCRRRTFCMSAHSLSSWRCLRRGPSVDLSVRPSVHPVSFFQVPAGWNSPVVMPARNRMFVTGPLLVKLCVGVWLKGDLPYITIVKPVADAARQKISSIAVLLYFSPP